MLNLTNCIFQYIAFLVVIMAAEIAAAVIVLVFKDQVCDVNVRRVMGQDACSAARTITVTQRNTSRCYWCRLII